MSQNLASRFWITTTMFQIPWIPYTNQPYSMRDKVQATLHPTYNIYGVSQWRPLNLTLKAFFKASQLKAKRASLKPLSFSSKRRTDTTSLFSAGSSKSWAEGKRPRSRWMQWKVIQYVLCGMISILITNCYIYIYTYLSIYRYIHLHIHMHIYIYTYPLVKNTYIRWKCIAVPWLGDLKQPGM